MRRVILIIAFLLMSCSAQDAARYQDPTLNFSHLEKFDFALAHIYVKEPERPIEKPANFPKDFLKPVPQDLVDTIVQDRFRSRDGQEDSALIVEIVDQKITELPIIDDGQKQSFWESILSKGARSYKSYRIDVAVKMTAEDVRNKYVQTYNLSAWQTVNIPDSSSFNERNYAWFMANEKLAATLNKNLDKELRNAFKDVIQ